MTYPKLLISLMALLSSSLAASLPAAAAPESDPEPRPRLVGVASASEWPQELDYHNSVVGSYPDVYGLFWSVEDDWSNDFLTWVLMQLEDRGVMPYAELTTNDLGALIAGDRDEQLDAMVAALGRWLNGGSGRRLLMGPLPEANLIDFPWGGDPAAYKAGYERIRTAFREADIGPDQVRFVFAMHGTSSNGFSMADFYPGDAVVDVVGFSIINRNNPWHGYDSAFQRFIDEIKSTITQSKPILVTQTASVVEGQDRDGWLRDMFDNLGAESQVIGIIYFNRAKTEGGKFNDYRVINDGWIDPVFREGARAWASPGGPEWLFDGRMDSWVAARDEVFAGVPYFGDIGGSPFEADIQWLASEGITQGCNPPKNYLFCPTDTVSRGQMAAFLVRALDLPPAGGDRFIDDNGSVFEGDIQSLAAAGITQGCNPPKNDRFCKSENVTRAQMAAFLVRALDLPDAGPANTFSDDDGLVFEGVIESLAAAGITQGCNPPQDDRFCPHHAVTRGQMAAFLARALR